MNLMKNYDANIREKLAYSLEYLLNSQPCKFLIRRLATYRLAGWQLANLLAQKSQRDRFATRKSWSHKSQLVGLQFATCWLATCNPLARI